MVYSYRPTRRFRTFGLILFIAILFSIPNSAKAQMYSGVWSEYYCEGILQIFCNTQYLSPAGDTIINSISYKKLYQWADSNLTTQSGYLGAYREDTSRRVLFIKPNTSNELMLYDFSAELGDTILSVSGGSLRVCDSVDMLVQETDSLMIDGTYHKSMKLEALDNWGMQFSWIEGIGCLSGFMYSTTPCWTDWGNELLCYKENDTTLYVNPSQNICFRLPTGSASSLIHTQVEVYFSNENPSSLHMRITGNFKVPYTLTMYNALGELVLKKKSHQKEILLNTSGVSSGVHLYQIKNESGRVLKGKVALFTAN